MSLRELNAAADLVSRQPRTTEETARLKNQLEEARVLKRTGVRANNLAAAADSRSVVMRIQGEVRNTAGLTLLLY
jgi:hypothetical protein